MRKEICAADETVPRPPAEEEEKGHTHAHFPTKAPRATFEKELFGLPPPAGGNIDYSYSAGRISLIKH